MDDHLRHDLNHLPDLLRKTLEVSVDYLASIESRPAAAPFLPVEPLALPDGGLGAERALDLFVERYGNAMPASNGPRFWGFVTGGSTPASLVGDWLTGALQMALENGAIEPVLQRFLRETI